MVNKPNLDPYKQTLPDSVMTHWFLRIRQNNSTAPSGQHRICMFIFRKDKGFKVGYLCILVFLQRGILYYYISFKNIVISEYQKYSIFWNIIAI